MADTGEPRFRTMGDMLAFLADGLRPPERLTIAQAAEKYRHIHNPGSYVGPWRNRMTPYLVEPMNELSSLDYRGWVFVSASQSGKTDLALNWLAYNAVCDPSDMMIVEVSQGRASDFSVRRVDRLHQYSPAVRERLLDKVGSDTVYRKRYNGMILNIGWPSKNELSGRPIPRLFLTDYDRMPLDVDGEGSAFILAQGRITTFGRHGMVAAESSPSNPVLDPAWTPQTPHEAPPCEGILSLYNRGDRRRWYWRCVSCKQSFEPTFSLLKWDDKLPDIKQMSESAWMECPHCGQKYGHDDGDVPGKFTMNMNGRWLRDGEMWLKDGSVVGDAVQSDVASFWLQGVAAAFKDWKTIVSKWLDANEDYLRTGSESELKATVNTDQSQPYTPKYLDSDRLPEHLKARAIQLPHRQVPDGVRFLVAAIDVQQTRFVVQVLGVGVNSDLWVVDRFDIRYSRRADDEAVEPGQFHRVRPFTYREDWRLLLTQVVLRTYPLADGSGRHMAIKTTVCDSGGMDRSTANAYDFWRWLKLGPSIDDRDADQWPEWTGGLHARFCLYRGVSTQVGYRVKMQYPDSGRQSRFSAARGDVPVLYVNVTPIKNQLDAILDRTDAGTGRVNFPDWLDLNFYKELTVEQKDLKGVWQNPRGYRNESWDLFVMALSVMLERKHVGIEQVNWTLPPSWADEWEKNDLVFLPRGTETPLANQSRSVDDLSKLGERLA